MRALLLHWPHIVPILIAAAAVLYLWREGARHDAAQRSAADEPVPARTGSRRAARVRAVSRDTALRGALVLGPAIAAVGTGGVIYGIDLAGRRPSAGLAWAHSGFSLLLCLLAVYKLAGSDLATARRRWQLGQVMQVGGSLLLAALLVPILATGIVVLVRPSSDSFAAYLHLIAAAWWTLLVLWHLARYLAPSLYALRSGVRRSRSGSPRAMP